MKNINVLYHKEKRNEEGKIQNYRKVTININGQDELTLCCCDINDTAQRFYDDRGVEFYLTLDKQNTQKFAYELGLKKAGFSEKEFLTMIHNDYGDQENCFLDLKGFFNSKNIDYQFSKW